MEVSVDYYDGRVREFSTTTFASSLERYVPGGGRNLVTEFDLRLDLLRSEGLRLDVYLNSLGEQDAQTIDMTEELGEEPDGSPRLSPVAKRYLFGSIQLIAPEELKGASYLLVRRCQETVAAAWRQGSGDWLVDGLAFDRAQRQMYTDALVTSVRDKELRMVRSLVDLYPNEDIRDIVAMTGMPYEAYREMSALGEGEEWE